MTLLVVFALASMVLVLGGSTRVELAASSNLAASMQASAVERGAEQYVLSVLASYANQLDTLTDDDFAGVPVGDGYFWVCRPDFGDEPLRLFGPVDEGSKLNLNYATVDQLLKLPNMTPETAASIVDWHDADDTPTNGSGAESSYYGSLPNPYQAKNANFETVEELLLVQGVSRELLYGTSAAPPLGLAVGTRSGAGQAATDLQTARGLYDLVTVYSKESAQQAAAAASSGAGGQANGNDGASAKVSIRDRTRRQELFDLLDKTFGETRSRDMRVLTGLTTEWDDVFTWAVRANLTGEEFDKIADRLTTTPAAQPGQPAPPQQAVRQGRINVNTAPRDVLACLPGLDTSDVDKLVSQRQSNEPGTTTRGWVIDALKEKAIDFDKYVTGTSAQYSADLVAVSGNGRAFRRVRIVVDTSGSSGTPRIVFRRDFTDRGWPMDPQILASLRAGRGLNGVANVRGPMGSGMAGGASR